MVHRVFVFTNIDVGVDDCVYGNAGVVVASVVYVDGYIVGVCVSSSGVVVMVTAGVGGIAGVAAVADVDVAASVVCVDTVGVVARGICVD